MTFNKEKAEALLEKELKFYAIRVKSWSRSAVGRAWSDRTVKIPKPIVVYS